MKFRRLKQSPLTEEDLIIDKIVQELILKLDQPEKWINNSWKTFVYSNRELVFEWKHDRHEKRITSPADVVIPKKWYSIIEEKVATIENFLEASKNRFLLAYLRGKYPVKISVKDKEDFKVLDWLLKNIKEDPYYFQSDKNLIWFQSEKIATFCKTALG